MTLKEFTEMQIYNSWDAKGVEDFKIFQVELYAAKGSVVSLGDYEVVSVV